MNNAVISVKFVYARAFMLCASVSHLDKMKSSTQSFARKEKR
jgi:hypothetical protein